MSNIELFEMSWYVRDHLFRRYNEEGREVVAGRIPLEMISTYLRYKNSDIRYVSELTGMVLEGLVRGLILVSDGSKLRMGTVFNRFQCVNCKYVSYLTRLEPMRCFRCGSEEMYEFNLKRNPA
jgi:hypothetical protein